MSRFPPRSKAKSLVSLVCFVLLFTSLAPLHETNSVSSATTSGKTITHIFVGVDLRVIEYNPYNNEIYVAFGGAYGEGQANLSIISGSSNKVIKTLTNFETGSLVYDPFNHDIYASLSTSVSVISPTNSIVANINLPDSYAGALVYDPSNHNIYVSSFNYMYAISPQNKLVGKILVQFWPFNSIAFDPENNYLYATEPSTNGQTYLGSVQVIDPARGTLASIKCGGCTPGDIIYVSTNHGIYFSETDYGVLAMINASTNKIQKNIHFPSDGARGLAFDTRNGHILLSGYSRITEINPATNSITSTFSPGGAPRVFTLDTLSNELYVAGETTELVNVVTP